MGMLTKALFQNIQGKGGGSIYPGLGGTIDRGNLCINFMILREGKISMNYHQNCQDTAHPY
jgi:hypothetical protein